MEQDIENESNKRIYMDLVDRIKKFMENEALSCSMDFGCVTPEYVYRMWGGSIAIEEISEAMKIVRQEF